MTREDAALGAGWRRLFEPVDNASLVLFRVAFGVIMTLEALRFLLSRKIADAYIEPTFHFKYYGFEWLEPWPGHGMIIHFVCLGLLAVLTTIGALYRVAATLFFLGFTYVFLLDEARYLNHFYLVALLAFMLIFLPVHRAVSIDAWLRPTLRSDSAPRWALHWVRAQLAVVYVYAGIAKINGDWLRGEPLRSWLDERAGMPLIGGLLDHEATAYLLSYGGLLYDLSVVPLLLWRRTRALAFGATAFFHLSNALLFDIGIFPWLMLAATTLFFEPDWPRRLRLLGRFEAAGSIGRPRRAIVVALALYLLVQALVPLRHHLYPGNVAWTEEGHRFSWRMKLRGKSGWGRFVVTDPASGRHWAVDPTTRLTERQAQKMTRIPDMILQFAHHLADEWRQQGYPDVEVRARVRVALNGRPPKLFIDPDVDLAAEPRNLRTASWILRDAVP